MLATVCHWFSNHDAFLESDNRLRRRPNIKPASGERLMIAGMAYLRLVSQLATDEIYSLMISYKFTLEASY